jgi:hypothetical protein
MNDLYVRIPPGVVPDVDSTDNTYIRDVIGNKPDKSFYPDVT